MVFHGGFSRGCRTCLKRRVKCDEGKPTCQRCIKSKKQCLGYRDDNDLAFKDETASTMRRANPSSSGSGSTTGSTTESTTTTTDFLLCSKTKGLQMKRKTNNNHKKNKNSSSSSSSSSNTTNNSTLTWHQLSPQDIKAAEEHAVQQFITHFAEPAAKSNASQGYFPYTKRFYAAAAPDSAIMLTLVALALTLTKPSSPLLLSESLRKRQALIRYGDAMRKVSEALNHPVESHSDGTTMAILLLTNLGHFLDTPSPIPHGIIHSTAAAHILRARGREMARDEESLQLLMRTRLTLAYNQAIRALPVQDLVDDNDPEALSWSELPTHIRTHPTHMLNSLALLVADLRARVKTLLSLPADLSSSSLSSSVPSSSSSSSSSFSSSSSSSPSSITLAANLVRECVEVESALRRWLQDIPSDWKEEIIDHQGIFIRISDTEVLRPCPGVQGLSRYRDSWVSNQHYVARDFRAFVQAMIIRCAAWISNMCVQDISPAQLEANLALLGFPGLKPTETLQDLVDSLCRSIFYNLGASTPPPRARSQSQPQQPNMNMDTNMDMNMASTDEIILISNSLQDLRPAVGAPYLTTRPLMIANSALIIPAQQQQWIKSVLRIVGKKLELSTSSSIAETPLGYEHPLFGVHPLMENTGTGTGAGTGRRSSDLSNHSSFNSNTTSPCPSASTYDSTSTSTSTSIGSILQTPSPPR